jgi:hypothetical protein
MDDQTKTISKQLYDAFLAYLIQSSTALDASTKALALVPLHSVHVSLLTESLDSAKILMSKVSIHPLIL